MELDVGGSTIYAYTGTRPLDPARPSVVFVHGAANDHSVWLLQSRYFAHHGRNALAVDLPGHGRSAGPALRSVEAIADWLPRVLDAARIAKASLVGHSLGALAALACAARHPDRVERIALCGPAVPMEVSEGLLAAAKADDHVAYELINGWSTSPGNEWQGGLAAAAGVRCPSLVVIGARDLMAPPRATRALVEALRGARVVTLPDTGHAMMAEQPDAVLDALRAFL